MKTFVVTIDCPQKGQATITIKANSEHEARNQVSASHPKCKVISVKELLLG